MSTATFRFYAELNDFLPARSRQRDVDHAFAAGTSVKDAVEALGPPHTEVDLILVNGTSVGFAHRLRDGDRVSVYPVFESFDVAGLSPLREIPLRDLRFVADVHLGKLARLLRLLGFDVTWSATASDRDIAETSAAQHRVALTRDRGLLKRRRIDRGLFVRQDDPLEQLIDVVSRLDLGRRLAPFTRCMSCNGRLVTVEKDEVDAMLPPVTRARVEHFTRCASCGRVYWRGAHHAALQRVVDDVRRRAGV